MPLKESIKNDWYKPANVISGLRLVFAWVPAYLLISDPADDARRWMAVSIFLLLSLTDALDGHIARRYNQVTEWGTFLDPLVDKALVAVMLIAITVLYPWFGLVAGIILLREVVVTLQIRSRGKIVAAIWSGKVKTAVQMAMIISLIIPWGGVWLWVQLGFIAAAIAVTIWSWIDYYKTFVKGR